MSDIQLFVIVFLVSAICYYFGYKQGKDPSADQRYAIFWSVGIGLIFAITWVVILKIL